VLHEFAGWSPYQQHTSAAWVIESPIAAMLLGNGAGLAAANSEVATTDKIDDRIDTAKTTSRLRIAAPHRPR
jgi:hypothetical protein